MGEYVLWFVGISQSDEAGMRINISKSETTVHNWQRVEYPCWVRDDLLPQVQEFKYFKILNTSKGTGKQEINR